MSRFIIDEKIFNYTIRQESKFEDNLTNESLIFHKIFIILFLFTLSFVFGFLPVKM
jgi:hypothetical protein